MSKDSSADSATPGAIGAPPSDGDRGAVATTAATVTTATTGWLDRHFALRARNTTPRIEALAGITSFLAAAYLLVVIPSLLATGGMDRGAATTSTIILFVAGTLFMGLYTNLPFMVGPGIGGSVIVGVTLAATEHVAWQTGLGIAFVSGALFLVLTLLGARSLVVRLIPAQIKLSLGASIGLFIAVLGFRNAGMVVANAKTNALALGDFSRPGTLVALTGLAAAVLLQGRRVPGAILWAILIAAAVGVPLGVTHLPAAPIALPHDIMPVSFKLDIRSALTIAALPYLFAFFAAEFFSTLGTTLAVGAKANLLDEHGNLPNINRPFLVDSIAAMLGPVLGIPAMTALVESAAGAEAGGRSGLSSLAAAAMFALTLLFVPVALSIPKEATAPALILIGLSMFSTIRHAQLSDFTDAVPVLFMVLLTLMSNSFGTGIAGGLLVYVLVKLLAGRLSEVPWGLAVLAVPLGYYFWTVVKPH
ncbi:NCS2 family permease [Paraburkholderia sp. B3]|uniref:NCS2 family permease n=1 Tax=Paraburkholderia sp. B3 TaxID=3134791 RepID=UPI003982A61B